MSIYCAEKALRDAKHLVDSPETFGRCYAEQIGGQWYCCCCHKPVRVVER